MLTILLSGATACFFGLSDFLGGSASRRDSAFAVTANAHLLGAGVFAAGVLLFPAPYQARDVVAGLVAGMLGGVGVTALYAALAIGRMSVVAPITAALSGALPAVYDLARGTRVGPYTVTGLVVALVAIVIVSMSGHADDLAGMPPRAIALSLLAGVGFAGAFVSFSFAGHGSGIVPLLAARVMSATLLGGITIARSRRIAVVPAARLQTYGAGALDAAANVTMLAAIRLGPLAIASVIGSLYPVVTILLARVVLGERLRGIQRAGVVLALVAVMLTALR